MGTMWRTKLMEFSPTYHALGTFSNWPASWELYSHSGRTTGRSPWSGAPVLLASSSSPNGVTVTRSPGVEPPVGQPWPGFDVTFPGDIKDFVPEIFGFSGGGWNDPYAWRGACRLRVYPYIGGVFFEAHSETPSPGLWFGQVQHNFKPWLYNDNYSYQPVEIAVTETFAFDFANMAEVRFSFGDGDEEQVVIPTFVRTEIGIGTTWSAASALYDYHVNADYITKIVLTDSIGRQTEYHGNFKVIMCDLIARKACGCDDLTGQMFLYRDAADGVVPQVRQNIASLYEDDENIRISLLSRAESNELRVTNCWRDERNDLFRITGPGGLGPWVMGISPNDGRGFILGTYLQWTSYNSPIGGPNAYQYFNATGAVTKDGTVCSAVIYGSGTPGDYDYELLFGATQYTTTPSFTKYIVDTKVADLDKTSRWVEDKWAIQVLDTGRVILTDCRTQLFYSDDLGRSWNNVAWQCWPDTSEEALWLYTSGRLVKPDVFVTAAVLATGEFPNYDFSLWVRTGSIINDDTLNIVWEEPKKLADLERQEPWVVIDLSLSNSGSIFATNCYDRFFLSEDLGRSWQEVESDG